jgi:hypothetical protein
MAPGVPIFLLKVPVGTRTAKSAAPDSLRNVCALQANIGQQAIVKLAQGAFRTVASKVSLEVAHQARRHRRRMVTGGFAAKVDRRHFFYSSSIRRLIIQSPKYLCVAQFLHPSMRAAPLPQAQLRNKAHANFAYLRSHSVNIRKNTGGGPLHEKNDTFVTVYAIFPPHLLTPNLSYLPLETSKNAILSCESSMSIAAPHKTRQKP